jgi:hypothetical protein
MGRADYKCLDDLLAQGLNPNVKQNPEKTELYLNTIHRKNKLADITTKDILTRETWQANDRCLKSLFSKVPDTKALRALQYQKGLSTQEIEDFMIECLNNSKEHESNMLNLSGIESLEPGPAPQASQRSQKS